MTSAGIRSRFGYKAKVLVSALIAFSVVLISGVSVFAWGPERQTYSIDSPAPRITFNAITNNPNHGDERNFTLAKLSSEGADKWRDVLDVTTNAEYTIRIYVHNNAAENLNLIAENVRAKASIPNTQSKEISVQGQISASNSAPAEVWDQVVFRSGNNFSLAYVPGSARYFTNVNPSEGFAVSDDVISSNGALLGYDKLDGRVPGCFKFSGILTFKVKSQVQGQADFGLTKQVRKLGETAWQQTIAAKPGDKIEYRLGYNNTGDVPQKNVIVKDTLPKGITYVKDSTFLKNASNASGDGMNVQSNELTNKGINIGNYDKNSNAFVKFTAQIGDAKELACGENKLVNKVRVSTDDGAKENTAIVTVQVDCAKPIEVCSLDTKAIITIDEKNFDDKKHSRNTADCAVAAPGELPSTGPAQTALVLAALVGTASLVVYEVQKRRKNRAAFASSIAAPTQGLLDDGIDEDEPKAEKLYVRNDDADRKSIDIRDGNGEESAFDSDETHRDEQ